MSTNTSLLQRGETHHALQAQLGALSDLAGSAAGTELSWSEQPTGDVQSEHLKSGFAQFRRARLTSPRPAMDSELLKVPLDWSLGAHLMARLSGPALILGQVQSTAASTSSEKEEAKIFDAPPTLRTLHGGSLRSASRVATFDVGLPGTYLLEVVTIFHDTFDPMSRLNKSTCLPRRLDPAYLGLIHVPRGRPGWSGYAAKQPSSPRFVFTRAQMCEKPPIIVAKAPDPRRQLHFYTAGAWLVRLETFMAPSLILLSVIFRSPLGDAPPLHQRTVLA